MRLKILGIHDGHNASATLLEDGKIRMVIQEERLTNIKNYWGFPFKSIKTILKLSNLTSEDIDYVTLASNHMPKTNDVKYLVKIFEFQEKHFFRSIIRRSLHKTPLYSLYKNKSKGERLKLVEKAGFSRKKVVFVDHHLCHAASAYFGSGWKDEKVLVMTLDGGGDGLCSTIWIGENGYLKRIAHTSDDNSLGNIYSRATFMMGFVPWEHEYKIMGMAPYVSESRSEHVYNIYKKYLSLGFSNSLVFKRNIPEPTNLIYKRLRKDMELQRFDWIAGGLQKFTEVLITKWVESAIKKTDIHKLALGGGVFMNVKANKRIMEIPEVESLFVFPSCGDESNSIGATYWVYAQKQKEIDEKINIPPLKEIYFGPDISNEAIELSIKKYRNEINFEYEYHLDIEKVITDLLTNGEIIARAKGRMEFGARALGNRSILADSSDLSNVRKINMMIKRRDFWMPFAPIIMKEREKEYIINPKNIPAPYMILSFDTTEKREKFIGAVHQADLTARPQVLEKGWNPGYYKILNEFEKETGSGVLLNTSFNLHGYPIVSDAEDALWVMKNSGLKYLALGNYLIQKEI